MKQTTVRSAIALALVFTLDAGGQALARQADRQQHGAPKRIGRLEKPAPPAQPPASNSNDPGYSLDSAGDDQGDEPDKPKAGARRPARSAASNGKRDDSDQRGPAER